MINTKKHIEQTVAEFTDGDEVVHLANPEKIRIFRSATIFENEDWCTFNVEEFRDHPVTGEPLAAGYPLSSFPYYAIAKADHEDILKKMRAYHKHFGEGRKKYDQTEKGNKSAAGQSFTKASKPPKSSKQPEPSDFQKEREKSNSRLTGDVATAFVLGGGMSGWD